MVVTKSEITTAPAFAVLPATDSNRARAFWEELGLEIQEAPLRGYFFVNAGMGTRFLVYETPAAHGQATAATFVVSDLEVAMNDLRRHGVQFEEFDMAGMKTVNGIADMGTMGRAAWFKDSEGNQISLAEM